MTFFEADRGTPLLSAQQQFLNLSLRSHILCTTASNQLGGVRFIYLLYFVLFFPSITWLKTAIN